MRNVTVTYSNGHTALEGAGFEIAPGSIAALVGINGSGKSTLFRAIMGFVPVRGGEISILGDPVRTALKAGAVAYVPQSEEVDWTYPVSVRDVVMMGRYGHMGWLRRAKAADHTAVDAALARVDLTALQHRQIGALSGGQKKRAFLARALAQNARVILLDEPFTGVDVKTEDAIITLLRQLRDDGRILLVSTHNLGSVPEFCDQTILLNRQVLASGPTAEVFTPENLSVAFGGMLRHFTLGGTDLHDDDDGRRVTVITDDERALVLYGDEEAGPQDTEGQQSPSAPEGGSR